MSETSILGSMKNSLYGNSETLGEAYDTELMIHINMYLATLRQLGIGLDSKVTVTGDSETWEQLTDNEQDLAMAKAYVYYRLKIEFDPPDNASVLNAYKESVKEIEWRAECGE